MPVLRLADLTLECAGIDLVRRLVCLGIGVK